jgi:sugar phosphate isomerase/epimerase
MQLSVMLGNFRQPFLEALNSTQKLEIPAIHLSAIGEYDPENCDRAARERLKSTLRERDLKISALSRWGGEVDLGDADFRERDLADAKRILEMAAEVMDGNGIWQAHIGIIPETPGSRWNSIVRSCEEIARHGEKVGACLAIETGPEPARVMEKLMQTIDSPALRVNYDPANLIIWPALRHHSERLITKYGKPEKAYNPEDAVYNYEPVEGVKRLGRFTVHTHAKDARVVDGIRQEMPLGEGWVDWPRYLQLLQESGYDGYLAIEREAGEDAPGDISRAAQFLRKQLSLLEQSNEMKTTSN